MADEELDVLVVERRRGRDVVEGEERVGERGGGGAEAGAGQVGESGGGGDERVAQMREDGVRKDALRVAAADGVLLRGNRPNSQTTKQINVSGSSAG